MASRKKIIISLIGLFLFALGLNLAVSFKLGITKPMQSDSMHFLLLAKSVSEGKGYYESETFWPHQPAMGRMPGWPFAVSVALRLFPATNSDMIMRLLCQVLNAGSALLVALLALRVWKSGIKAVMAGILFAVHPTALFLAYEGLSEILFVFLILAGALCLTGFWITMPPGDDTSCSGGRQWRKITPWLLPIAGFTLLGCACIVRANLILWIGFFFLFWLIYALRTGLKWRLPLSIVCASLFLLPSALWMFRNYTVCGHFPVVSTLKGEVLYGGSNPVTAFTWEFWGYWVFPDNIPGEKTKRSLAASMSEYELDRYYSGKARLFIRENLGAMPVLVLGRLVRAYVPIPWKPKWGSLCVSAFRWGIYLAAAVGLWVLWKRLDRSFKLVFMALLCTNMATVVIFWGCARFAFDIEPFLVLFSVGLWDILPGLKQSRGGTSI